MENDFDNVSFSGGAAAEARTENMVCKIGESLNGRLDWNREVTLTQDFWSVKVNNQFGERIPQKVHDPFWSRGLTVMIYFYILHSLEYEK